VLAATNSGWYLLALVLIGAGGVVAATQKSWAVVLVAAGAAILAAVQLTLL
jgi:hypothetical protein